MLGWSESVSFDPLLCLAGKLNGEDQGLLMITEVIDINIQIISYNLSWSTSVALFQLSTLAKVIIYYNR